MFKDTFMDGTELVNKLVRCYNEAAVLSADELKDVLEQTIDVLEELIKSKWVSVNERFPAERTWVLCRCRANIYEVLRWYNGGWYHDVQHNYMSGFVTHWMPLPEPPKEVAND